MNDHLPELAHRYSVALREYLSEPQEAALAHAYELGRTAFAHGLGVLEMAAVHARAMADLLGFQSEDKDRPRELEALERVFAEALSPFEMAHRGFRDANAVLQRLNDRLEEQASRIASALHAEAGQLLTSIHLGLSDVAKSVPADTARKIQSVRVLLDQIEERLRHISHELRPSILDDLGLVPAIEFLADGVSKRWGIPVIVRASIRGRLGNVVETTLYRTAQEGLTNAAKHARATQIEVSVSETAEGVVCSVSDNGIGIESAAVSHKRGPGLGLAGIRERVTALDGIVRVNPAPYGRGTMLTVEIPLGSRP